MKKKRFQSFEVNDKRTMRFKGLGAELLQTLPMWLKPYNDMQIDVAIMVHADVSFKKPYRS